MVDIEKYKEYLHKVRLLEFEQTLQHLPSDAKNQKLLEIGSGTGYQLLKFKKIFKEALGVDIIESNYRNQQLEEVTIIDYDGTHLPFEDGSFDVIFSSNTMEHVVDLDSLEQEMKRVLKPTGICIHLMPTHLWKIWTILFHYLNIINIILGYIQRKKRNELQNNGSINEGKNNRGINRLFMNTIFPALHGERGNRFTEVFYFHPSCWKKHFLKNEWKIVKIVPTGVGYSSYNMFPKWNKLKLAKIVGSSCFTYILKK